MEFNHELIIPNEDLPFKMFVFEGACGGYYRDKHWHRSVEIFAVFEGSLDFYLEEERYSLHSGEFMLVNSNEIHSIDARVSNYTVVLQIPFKVFENYYTAQQFVRFTHDRRDEDRDIMKLIREMYTVYCGKQCGYELQVISRYYSLLYLLVTAYREMVTDSGAVRQNQKLYRLSVITDYIKENYTSELSLEILADMFGYSPAYLSKMLKRYAGINYKTYLQNIRLECAYKDLLHTRDAIGEIAMRNGFPSSKAFTRVFQTKYQMTPSEYRMKMDKK